MIKIKERVTSIGQFWRDLMFPPKCCHCGRLLEPDDKSAALCEDCLKKWDIEKDFLCEICGETAQFCRCCRVMSKSGLVRSYSSCIMYDTEISKSVVTALKYKGYPRVMQFCANEILNNIYSSYDIDFSNSVILYPQRAKKSVKKYGFDHAEILADLVGKATNIPVYKGVRHKGGTNQKTLDLASRGKNAFANLYIDEKGKDIGALKGKTAIVIDDVITTGATGICIAALAHNKGAEKVKIFSLARTPRKKQRIL